MKIFIVAGEASGDSIGASLIQSFHQAYTEHNNTSKDLQSEDLEFLGIGGPKMKDQGFNALLDIDALSVMGIWEVIPKLPQLLKILSATKKQILKEQPNVVLTIDYPEFNFLLASWLKKHCPKITLVHYVAPTVWAWREGRAKKVAKFLDGIICLYPFEPAYFTKHGLKAIYVGHPLTESTAQGLAQEGSALTQEGSQNNEGTQSKIDISKNSYKKQLGIEENTTTIGLFFGSRSGELNYCGSVIKDCAKIVQEHLEQDIHFIIPTIKEREAEISQILNDFPYTTYLISQEDKWSAMKACDAAIAVSGTVCLELSYLSVAHICLYKTNALTYWLVKLLAKVKHIHLANIILQRALVPEYIQNDTDPLVMSKKVIDLLENKNNEYTRQLEGFEKMQEILNAQKKSSASFKAAEFILQLHKKK